MCGRVCLAHRSRGAPWPLWRSVSVGGRSVAACPAGPELQDSPSAGSPSAQTVPSASCSACGHTHNNHHCWGEVYWMVPLLLTVTLQTDVRKFSSFCPPVFFTLLIMLIHYEHLVWTHISTPNVPPSLQWRGHRSGLATELEPWRWQAISFSHKELKVCCLSLFLSCWEKWPLPTKVQTWGYAFIPRAVSNNAAVSRRSVFLLVWLQWHRTLKGPCGVFDH